MPQIREQNTVARGPNWNPAMYIGLHIVYCRFWVTIPQLNNGQERYNTTTNQGGPSALRFYEPLQKRRQKDCNTQSLGKTDTHRSSQRLWPHEHALHRPKPDQVPALRRESGREFPSLT